MRHPPKTTTGSSTTSTILRTLQALAPPPAENCERVVDYEILKTLHAPASPPVENRERVVDHEKNMRTLRAPAPPPAENHERVLDYEQNSEDAPRGNVLDIAVAPCKLFARRHSESDSTGTIPQRVGRAIRHAAEGSPFSLRICTAPQRERFDKHPAEGWQTSFKIGLAPQRERSDKHETRRGFAPTIPDKPTPALEMREHRRRG